MSFRPGKELVQNQLMRVPAVRARAQRSHNTGIQQDPVRTQELFDRYLGFLDRPLADSAVLELGPGRGTGMMKASLEAGVGSYAAFDVEPYLTPEELPSPTIDYRTGGDGRLPWDDETFDVIWSHSVMEHVRRPGELLAEVARVLKPGGRHIADIDFRDHYQPWYEPSRMYNMLRYSERMWDLMTSNRSSWTNRLRYSEWPPLFEAAGLQVLETVPRRVESAVAEYRKLPYLAQVSDDDLLVYYAAFITTR